MPFGGRRTGRTRGRRCRAAGLPAAKPCTCAAKQILLLSTLSHMDYTRVGYAQRSRHHPGHGMVLLLVRDLTRYAVHGQTKSGCQQRRRRTRRHAHCVTARAWAEMVRKPPARRMAAKPCCSDAIARNAVVPSSSPIGPSRRLHTFKAVVKTPSANSARLHVKDNKPVRHQQMM